jgi:translation initiation factor IF-1
MSDSEEYIRMSGVVIGVERNATFLVELDGGLQVTAKAGGRLQRGRKIRILPGDQVDVDVSTYDTARGRIVWRRR